MPCCCSKNNKPESKYEPKSESETDDFGYSKRSSPRSENSGKSSQKYEYSSTLDDQAWNDLNILRQKACKFITSETDDTLTDQQGCHCHNDFRREGSNLLRRANDLIDYTPQSEFLKRMKHQCQLLAGNQPNIFSALDRGLENNPRLNNYQTRGGEQRRSPVSEQPRMNKYNDDMLHQNSLYDPLCNTDERLLDHLIDQKLPSDQNIGRSKNQKSEHVSRSKKPSKYRGRRKRKSGSAEKCESENQFEPTLKRPHENSCERCWRFASPSRSPVNKPDQKYDPNFRRGHSCYDFESGDAEVYDRHVSPCKNLQPIPSREKQQKSSEEITNFTQNVVNVRPISSAWQKSPEARTQTAPFRQKSAEFRPQTPCPVRQKSPAARPQTAPAWETQRIWSKEGQTYCPALENAAEDHTSWRKPPEGQFRTPPAQQRYPDEQPQAICPWENSTEDQFQTSWRKPPESQSPIHSSLFWKPPEGQFQRPPLQQIFQDNLPLSPGWECSAEDEAQTSYSIWQRPTDNQGQISPTQRQQFRTPPFRPRYYEDIPISPTWESSTEGQARTSHSIWQRPPDAQMPSCVGQRSPDAQMPSCVGQRSPEAQLPSSVGPRTPQTQLPSSVGQRTPQAQMPSSAGQRTPQAQMTCIGQRTPQTQMSSVGQRTPQAQMTSVGHRTPQAQIPSSAGQKTPQTQKSSSMGQKTPQAQMPSSVGQRSPRIPQPTEVPQGVLYSDSSRRSRPGICRADIKRCSEGIESLNLTEYKGFPTRPREDIRDITSLPPRRISPSTVGENVYSPRQICSRPCPVSLGTIPEAGSESSKRSKSPEKGVKSQVQTPISNTAKSPKSPARQGTPKMDSAGRNQGSPPKKKTPQKSPSGSPANKSPKSPNRSGNESSKKCKPKSPPIPGSSAQEADRSPVRTPVRSPNERSARSPQISPTAASQRMESSAHISSVQSCSPEMSSQPWEPRPRPAIIGENGEIWASPRRVPRQRQTTLDHELIECSCGPPGSCVPENNQGNYVTCCHCDWENPERRRPSPSRNQNVNGYDGRAYVCPHKKAEHLLDEQPLASPVGSSYERDCRLLSELQNTPSFQSTFQGMSRILPAPREYFLFYMTKSKENKLDDDVEVLVEELTQACPNKTDSRSKDLTEKMKKIMECPSDSMALKFQKGVSDQCRIPQSSRILYF